MDSLTIPETYAQALLDACHSVGGKDKTSEVASEIEQISALFREQPELRRLFSVPTLTAVEKKDAAEKIFGGKVSAETLAFLYVLIDRRRIDAWDAIVRKFGELIDEQEGVARGILYSALPIDGERLSGFEKEASLATEKKVKLENRIDKSLIGGVALYVSGKLIDISVKGRLEQLRRRALASSVG